MKSLILILFAGIALLTGCATTQDFIILDDRLTDLEQYKNESERNRRQINALISDLNKISDQKNQNVLGQYAGLRAEIKQMLEEARVLNGKFEETEFALKKVKDSIQAIEGKLDRLDITATQNTDRIIRLEQYLGLESLKQKSTTPGKTDKTPEYELYTRAKLLFDKKKYKPARLSFQKFINEYPRSKNADNAQFWIGETYYQEKWYEKAILEYDEVKKKYPKGNKMPASLLKQGLSFKNLGEKSNAKLILDELIQKYPQSKEAGIARQKLKALQ